MTSNLWRRTRTIPAMLGATLLAFATLPVAVPGLVLVDLLAGRPRLPRLRVYAVVLQYLVNDSVEVVLAPWYWLLAGFGMRLAWPPSLRRHARLQRWSSEVLARRAERLLGLRIEIVEGRAGGAAPLIVLARHVNLTDASLPGLLYMRGGDYDVRGVLMRELLADPGFDLIYARLGSVFVDRDGKDESRAAIRTLGTGLDARSVAVIFPEGRLVRPERRDRDLARLAEAETDRAERLAGLRHLLPPRPGGVLALLEGAPHADVAVVAHAGFESVPSLAELCRRAPLDHPIEVSVRRVRRQDIPEAPDAQVRRLDDEWLRMDDWIEARLSGVAAGPSAEAKPKLMRSAV
jgi:1-acyl-sn-glycerol-3-phosphate acyltransferase